MGEQVKNKTKWNVLNNGWVDVPPGVNMVTATQDFRGILSPGMCLKLKRIGGIADYTYGVITVVSDILIEFNGTYDAAPYEAIWWADNNNLVKTKYQLIQNYDPLGGSTTLLEDSNLKGGEYWPFGNAMVVDVAVQHMTDDSGANGYINCLNLTSGLGAMLLANTAKGLQVSAAALTTTYATGIEVTRCGLSYGDRIEFSYEADGASNGDAEYLTIWLICVLR